MFTFVKPFFNTKLLFILFSFALTVLANRISNSVLFDYIFRKANMSRKIKRENCPSAGKKEKKQKNKILYIILKAKQRLIDHANDIKYLKLTIFFFMQKLKLAINNAKITYKRQRL